MITTCNVYKYIIYTQSAWSDSLIRVQSCKHGGITGIYIVTTTTTTTIEYGPIGLILEAQIHAGCS